MPLVFCCRSEERQPELIEPKGYTMDTMVWKVQMISEGVTGLKAMYGGRTMFSDQKEARFVFKDVPGCTLVGVELFNGSQSIGTLSLDLESLRDARSEIDAPGGAKISVDVTSAVVDDDDEQASCGPTEDNCHIS